MINSIPKIESKELNKFGHFTARQMPSDYWLPTQDSVEISKQPDVASKENKEESIAASKIIISPEKARKTKNVKVIGLSIATATVLTAASVFFLLKGGTKNLTKNFEKLRDYFERQLLTSKLNNGDEMSLTNKVYVYLIKSLDSVAKKTEAVNNFTTLKDMAFKKLMGVNKYLRRGHDKITRLFEKIGRHSVNDSYKSTFGRLQETKLLQEGIANKIMQGDSFDIVEIKGIKKTKAQWLAEVNAMNDEMRDLFNSTFSQKALHGRYVRFKRAAEDLKKAFASLKVFFSKDFFLQFMAESKIVKEKEAVQKLVHNTRKQLSYSVVDLVQDTNDLIIKMTGSISFKDAERIRQLRMIKTDIRSFATTADQNPALKSKIIQDITSFSEDLKKAISAKTIDESIGKELLENVTELNDVFTNFKQGKVEQILDIYKAILPKDDYDKISKSYKSGIKSLNKSIRLETEEFISKLRDLTLGSAPTDILAMLGALGILGYQLGKSEDRDERISIALKYGIPALVGSVGITLYCNAKLFAGTKSLIIGNVSALVLNRLGEWADNKLKEYRMKQKQLQAIT